MTDWEALELENTPAKMIIDYGQLNPDQTTFLSTFGSERIYKDQVARLKDYFFHYHAMKREDGIPLYAPTTYRNWFSISSEFWLMSGRGDLKENISPNKKRTRDDIQ